MTALNRRALGCAPAGVTEVPRPLADARNQQMARAAGVRCHRIERQLMDDVRETRPSQRRDHGASSIDRRWWVSQFDRESEQTAIQTSHHSQDSGVPAMTSAMPGPHRLRSCSVP